MILAAIPLLLPAATPKSEPPTLAQCFQVQYLVRLPNLEAKQFVQSVAALGNDQDQGALPPLTTLHQQADALRSQEHQSYVQLSALLVRMGAPASLRAWAAADADRLSRPVPLSADQQKDAKTDPDTAAVLATMDEAQALNSDNDDHMTALGTWISLSYRQPGLWAADIGEVTAALHVAAEHQTPPKLAAHLAAHLQQSAPAGTPETVLHALSLLQPASSGNLSGLISSAEPIPLPAATQAAALLMTAFALPPSP